MINISKEIFRAYDIRGVVEESLTDEVVYTLGRALGTAALAVNDKAIIVGCDGRLSSPAFIAALSQGILNTGCNVIDIGRVPTPVLYFATHYLNNPSGVIITGSHNPSNYNGFKIVLQGRTLYGDGIQKLYQIIQTDAFQEGRGTLTQRDVKDAYVKHIQETVPVKHALKVVVDCGNGVTGELAPLLYKALGCKVIPLFSEVDGNFPNHHPDPGQPKNLVDLIQAVKTHQADLGLAFDGDGDRVGVVDNAGNIIWPDRLLMLFAKDILSRHRTGTIIFDVKCTRHVTDVISKCGGNPVMWKTGHSLIKAKMLETNALLAGEMSGHLFFKERWYGFDDGLYAGARLLEIVSKGYPKTVSELFSTIPDSVNTPELYLPVTEQNKFEKVQQLINLARFKDAVVNTIDGLRVDFRDGFGLVRPSNTGPNLILRFEGDTETALQRIQMQFRQLLLAVEPTWALPF